MRVNGTTIKEYREAQKLTTSDLAARIKPPVTRQAVESWEKKGIGGFRLLGRVAKALGVPPALLIDSSNGD